MSSLTEMAIISKNSEGNLKNTVKDDTLLRFEPFLSCLDPNFWFKVSQLKLDVDKLNGIPKPLFGYYSANSSPYMSVDSSSFNLEVKDKIFSEYISRGYCLNKNSLDSFNNCDKNALLKEFGECMLDDFRSGRAIDDPCIISAFNILIYSDLELYHFYFWFAFPTFAEPIYYLTDTPAHLKNMCYPIQFDLFLAGYQDINVNQRGYFGIIPTEDGNPKVVTLKEFIHIQKHNSENTFIGFLAFADPSDLLNNPGWPLRNLLYLILLHCPSIRTSVLKVIALRGTSKSKFSESVLFNIKVSSNIEMVLKQDCIKFVGWEKNVKGMFSPKYVDLSKIMDPKKQAVESINLNLKLMKWQIVPDLDLDSIAESKCLIIGAGTLGCCVARNLMSWGVHNITIIDNGEVTLSNPVRQSLYNYAHCIKSNTYKAIAAADMLREIHPKINSSGVVMKIPMLGHTANIDDYKNVDILSKLIEDHDVIFLLTDSRESRWLPTMLSTLHNKLAITALLGFDSYLVLRHGNDIRKSSHKNQLCCCFCNDVTAPRNSLVDKSMGEQCIVSRPGVSSIAGALAAELFVSYVQLKNAVSSIDGGCLGMVPHSITGFLFDVPHMSNTSSLVQCIACSEKVINVFLNKKEEFLNNVFTNPTYLEDLTGLTDLKNKTEDTLIYEMNDLNVEGLENNAEK